MEIYNADAAGDEQLAGRMLRSQSLDDVTYQQGFMPNIKIIHRDKTHACRRLTQRGLNAGPFLQQV